MLPLKDLADLQATGSEQGKVIESEKPIVTERIQEMLLTDTFRHNLNKAVSIRDIWHWVLFIGGCLFFLMFLIAAFRSIGNGLAASSRK